MVFGEGAVGVGGGWWVWGGGKAVVWLNRIGGLDGGVMFVLAS